MLSVNYSNLKLNKTQDTKIIIDYQDNSQKLTQLAKTPVKFATSNQDSSDLIFSYRIFDKNSIMLANNEVNISKSLLFFNPNTLNTHNLLNFVSKNKFPECELVLDTSIVLSENHIKTIENIRNEISSKIEKSTKAKNEMLENIKNGIFSEKKVSFSKMLRDRFDAFLKCLNCYKGQPSVESE
ncbi:hypothetical protein SteCoe_7257 [Stentor coeruleus]|uniref:Uncharacterized protein n=1 Tax=Stentor coeruleus TaxID=5963 RepID=A0A1R2CMV3_9CILI|nr:hypothetical protein SteCoe_7257 [Stentor coeruleus]